MRSSSCRKAASSRVSSSITGASSKCVRNRPNVSRSPGCAAPESSEDTAECSELTGKRSELTGKCSELLATSGLIPPPPEDLIRRCLAAAVAAVER